MPSEGYEAILKDLVSFDTTSRNSNLPLIDYIVRYLEEYGVTSTLVPNEDGDKASLYAIIGPENIGGLGLSGHTDVVPVDGQTWSYDPFDLTFNEGRYFGRGTTDMKGFLACSLALVPELVKRDLKIPIHLLYSYDEEIGCVGVQPMINEFGESLPQPRMVIVGEPTSMQVAEAHKGIHTFVTEVRGKETHSSLPDLGVNAVTYACRFVAALEQLGGTLKSHHVDDRFYPAYSTLHVGTIQGGTALNIVAKSCRIVWEIRSLPDADVDAIKAKVNAIQDELIAEMKAVSPETGFETTETNYVPAFQATKDGHGEEFISHALRCAGVNELGTAPYGTEAGWFERKGCPTLLCGPGSIEQAHQPDEYIEKEQLEKCMTFLRAMINQVS